MSFFHIWVVSRGMVIPGVFFCFCWNECSDARTYPVIEIWTVTFSYSHFSAIPMCNFNYQSMVTLYLSSSAAFRCKACYFFEYFTPKVSTTKVKLIGQFLCVHSPGVLLEGWYPYRSRCFNMASCDIRPDWGSPYMPLVTLA